METEHTTIRLDADVKRKAEKQAKRENVKPAEIMRRWMRIGSESEALREGQKNA